MSEDLTEDVVEDTPTDIEPGAESEDTLEAPEETEGPTAEDVARDRGWKPSSEWKGDIPPNFIDDPEKFNDIYENSNPRLKKEVADLRAQMEAQSKFVADMQARHKQEMQDQLQRLQAELPQAINTGDAGRANAIVAERDKLRDEAAKDPVPDNAP